MLVNVLSESLEVVDSFDIDFFDEVQVEAKKRISSGLVKVGFFFLVGDTFWRVVETDGTLTIEIDNELTEEAKRVTRNRTREETRNVDDDHLATPSNMDITVLNKQNREVSGFTVASDRELAQEIRKLEAIKRVEIGYGVVSDDGRKWKVGGVAGWPVLVGTPTQKEIDRTTPTLTLCGVCKAKVSSNAPTCPHCGEPRPAGNAPPTERCVNCRTEIAVDASICPHCRTHQDADQYWANWWGFVIVFLLIFWGLGYILTNL